MLAEPAPPNLEGRPETFRPSEPLIAEEDWLWGEQSTHKKHEFSEMSWPDVAVVPHTVKMFFALLEPPNCSIIQNRCFPMSVVCSVYVPIHSSWGSLFKITYNMPCESWTTDRPDTLLLSQVHWWQATGLYCKECAAWMIIKELNSMQRQNPTQVNSKHCNWA